MLQVWAAHIPHMGPRLLIYQTGQEGSIRDPCHDLTSVILQAQVTVCTWALPPPTRYAFCRENIH